ncbi:hypothetical protein Tco_0052553 [Tanacetum coccineum]
MSDSEDSTVTYTEISSPYEDLSDVGSPGVEGPIFQDPPSPDYVPGPEEPEQAPPSPIYVPLFSTCYPEFLPVDDEIFPAEEQPMPAADSPTHQSPGYIPESDPEEDPEEEDPEEDPADYPADRGDDRDDDDDAEEEDHLAPADPVADHPERLHLPPYKGVNQRVTELATTVDQEDEIIYSQLDDARYDRALLRA